MKIRSDFVPETERRYQIDSPTSAIRQPRKIHGSDQSRRRVPELPRASGGRLERLGSRSRKP